MILTKTKARVFSLVIASLMLASQFAAPLSALADHLGAYNAQLTSPTPPASSDTYTWQVSGSKPHQAEEISHVNLTGCWVSNDILSVTALNKNSQSKSTETFDGSGNSGNPDGLVKVDGVQDVDLPLTITVSFKTAYASNGNSDLFVKTGGGQNAGVNFTPSGPNCQDPDTGSVKVDKKVDADGDNTYEGGNSEAQTLGFNWGLDSETPGRAMDSTVADVQVGAHTVTENSVNGYVFTGWYFTNNQQGNDCENPNGTTLPANITVVKNETAGITLCNQAKNGNITIIKDSQPDAGRNFEFRIRKPSIQWNETFWLDDDGNNSNQLSNTETYDNLLAGTYIVKELTNNSNWTLNDIVCSDGASVVVDLDNRRAVISLGHDDSVTCTFVNQKKGEIKVFKHTDPAGDQTDFDIQASGTGTIFGNATKTIADGQSRTFKVGHGTFSVSETLPAGWSQVSNSCQDLVIDADNLYRECHITNAKEAKLKIVKDAVPDAPRNFRFTSPQLGNFRLDDDNDNALDNSKQFNGLAAGTYAVTEQQTNGWFLTGITCDGTQNYRVKLTDGRLAVNLKAGDDVTCTFTNERGNVIKGFKFNDLNGNGKRDQGEPGLEGWTIELESCPFSANSCTTASTTTDANGFYRFAGLDIGEYEVCEVQQSGWVQTKPSNNQCYEAYFEVYNQKKRADFGNFQLGKVQGVKFNDVNGNGQRDQNEPLLEDWEITLTKDCLARITQVALCEPPKTTETDSSGAYSFENLTPGKYKVCETQQTIWAQTYPTTADGCHEFEITTSGQMVETDFGNKAKPQVLGDQDEKQAPQVLAVTGSSHTAQALLTGLTILGTLAALHFLTIRRKDYAK